MEARNVYTKWGLHTAAKGSLSGSNGHHHCVRHVKKPPPTLSVHSNPTVRERIRAKMSFTHPQFCSRLLSAAKTTKNALSLLFFLSPLTLKLLQSSIATFRALKRPKLTSERPEMSRRLTNHVVTSHCTLGIPILFAISHTFASAPDSKPHEVGSSSIVMISVNYHKKTSGCVPHTSMHKIQFFGLLTQPDALGFLLLHKNIQILIIVKYKHTVHFTACLNPCGPHVVIWLQKMSKPLLNHQCMCMYICHITHSKKCLTQFSHPLACQIILDQQQ